MYDDFIELLGIQKILVTFWAKFVKEFDPNIIHEKEKDGPVIIILTGMTVRRYRGK